MSVTLEVALLSGRTVTVEAGQAEQVEQLKLRAQIVLGVGKGRLLDLSGSVLDSCSTVEAAKLHNGDSLTLHIARLQIQSTISAFAAILGDASVVTWGLADHGGGRSTMQHRLKNVQQIQASDFAFAAILGDGSVVTWGDAGNGGDSSAVQDQLQHVQQIQASERAFAAILSDGSAVIWGRVEFGGDSSAVQDQLRNVTQIQATGAAFAAILADGTVVSWGDADDGGDSSAVQDQLQHVQQISLLACFCCHSWRWLRRDMG